MKIIDNSYLHARFKKSTDPVRDMRSIGAVDTYGLARDFEMPVHVAFLSQFVDSTDDLQSISWYSLCKGLFVPALFHPSQVPIIFSMEMAYEPVRSSAETVELGLAFMSKDTGIPDDLKLACLLSSFEEKTGVATTTLVNRVFFPLYAITRTELLERMNHHHGDLAKTVAAIVVEKSGRKSSDPPLTSNETLLTVKHLGKADPQLKIDILKEMFGRCGPVEAFFLVMFIIKKFDTGFLTSIIEQILAGHYGVDLETVRNASAIVGVRETGERLMRGEDITDITVQPLLPFYPCLASNDKKIDYPARVEPKFDGIRMMIHRSKDTFAAYTRRRNDWSEFHPGLKAIADLLPPETILDGELTGYRISLDGMTPVPVYEAFKALTGTSRDSIRLVYHAFDILYLRGNDLSKIPLRMRLELLKATLAGLEYNPLDPLSVQLDIVDGQVVSSAKEENRYYQFYRSKGVEGIVIKDLDERYHFGGRAWRKRKQVIDVDVAVTGLLFRRQHEEGEVAGAQRVGSVEISAYDDGNFVPVGTSAGLSIQQSAEIQAMALTANLITGTAVFKQPDRDSLGLKLRPAIVASIGFQDITRDSKKTDQQLSLRHPRVLKFRIGDKNPSEVLSMKELERMHSSQLMK
ncbi:MAG: hypothetical protein ACFFD4_34955 [Candidatus Odinarchaeota archaeon]